MELIKKEANYYLYTPKYVDIYYQGQKIASGCDEINLGSFEEIHPVFEVHTDDKIEYIAQRHIEGCGIVNFRDLGGYRTKDGKQIAYHHFYRGAAILPETDTQKQRIDSLGLKTIVDLRSDREIKGREDYVSEGTNYRHHSGISALDNPETQGSFDFEYLVQSGNIYALKGYMAKTYETMAIRNSAFQALIDYMKKGETPIYFHCSAGKDRTGVGAMLILLCLGVDEQTIFEDYLLSNVYRQKANEMMLDMVDQKYREETKPLYYVYEEYLRSTLDTIKQTYGSIDAYFEQEHHLSKEDREVLKEKYCL